MNIQQALRTNLPLKEKNKEGWIVHTKGVVLLTDSLLNEKVCYKIFSKEELLTDNWEVKIDRGTVIFVKNTNKIAIYRDGFLFFEDYYIESSKRDLILISHSDDYIILGEL